MNDETLLEALTDAIQVLDEYFCDYLGHSTPPNNSIGYFPPELPEPNMGRHCAAWSYLQDMCCTRRIILDSRHK